MLSAHFKYSILFFCLLLLLGISQNAYSQLTESQARELLLQKGIPEDTLRNRLLKKGFDPDKIRPEQIESFQIVVIETIREIEADQVARTSPRMNPVIRRDTQPVIIDPVTEPVIPDLETGEITDILRRPQIYGQEIFRNNSIKVFQRATDIIPTDDYVLGTGDKLGIVGFGRSQFEEILEIRADGMVHPSGLPRMLLKGLTLGEAKELLFQRYNQYFVIGRGQFQVTLTQPRNITVNVFGEVRTPGSYTVPEFNIAFNLISAAGGPTDIGSVRKIKVISGSQTRILDVYEFMSDPSVAKNFFLQSNDVVHVPVADKVITIEGAVIRPMAYELLGKENLTMLLHYAGGVLPEAYLSDVKITRFLADRQVITNVNYRDLLANGGDYVLYNGDIVEIKTIEEDVFNYVSVSGAV